MNDRYAKIFNQTADAVSVLSFAAWMAVLALWVLSAYPAADASVLLPLALVWLLGAALFMLLGRIPVLLAGALAGGLFAGLALLKHRLRARR
ncbi:TPA: hypothetical protein ACFNMI_000687 [Neisseria bacilliformis]|nr:hypothetical protein [Neisseria bacilliformis]